MTVWCGPESELLALLAALRHNCDQCELLRATCVEHQRMLEQQRLIDWGVYLRRHRDRVEPLATSEHR